MKLLVFSDLHGDWTTGGFERFGELVADLDQVRSYATTRGVERVLFLGDLSDPDGPLAHRAIAAAVAFDRSLDHARIHCEWLIGNHDVFGDGRRSHTLMAITAAGGRVHARPYNFFDADVEFVMLPYVSDERYDPAAYVRSLTDSQSRTQRGLVRAVVVAGHMTIVPGARAGSESTDMARGSDMKFPLEEARELAQVLGAKLVCMNGHMHQRVVDGPVLIPGSAARLTHGEEDLSPGFLIVEV